MSSAYHPQSNGQTEVLNKVIEQYLRAFVHRRPKMWGKLLPWVEWSHNTSWNAGSSTTPFEITFGRKPFNFPEYIAGTSKIAVVEESISDREITFQAIRKKLIKAQERMKLYADKKRREVTYECGEWVLLKLRPHRQTSAKGSQAITGKLAKRFYEPFQITERIGPVAYRLQLPENARIHPIFHCSMLKSFKGSPENIKPAELPPNFADEQPLLSPLAILGRRRTSSEPNSPWEVLVQ